MKNDVEKYILLFDFLSSPYDTRELWNMVGYCVMGNEFSSKRCRILHSRQLTSDLGLKATELELVRNKKLSVVGAGRKVDLFLTYNSTDNRRIPFVKLR